jgi:hypothetical protein
MSIGIELLQSQGAQGRASAHTSYEPSRVRPAPSRASLLSRRASGRRALALSVVAGTGDLLLTIPAMVNLNAFNFTASLSFAPTS